MATWVIEVTEFDYEARLDLQGCLEAAMASEATEQPPRAVVEGARATLREARPLSALVDQSTQTVAVAAEGEIRNRVTFAQEKNGIAATSAPSAATEGGSKCAVQ